MSIQSVPLWDQANDPTTVFGTTPQDVADYYVDSDAATTSFYLLGRAISNMVGDVGRPNNAKGKLFFWAAIATGFDCTGYASYDALLARYGLPS